MDKFGLPNLFLDEESSDVDVVVETTAGGPKVVIPAHGLILRLASKVFRAMEATAGSNRTGKQTLSLKVKGNMDDALCFLRYLYTGELKRVHLSTCVSLLQTAHLYDVDDLVQLCNRRIVGEVTPLNVCRTYMCLRNVASESLLSHCSDMMLRFAFLIFKKDLHLTLGEETMAFLLASDKLNLLDEQQALGALWRWWCTRQTHSDHVNSLTDKLILKLLPLIRRPFITNVDVGSPWYVLWTCFTAFKENELLNLPSGSGNIIRKPDVSTINKFAQVAGISRVAHRAERISAKDGQNRLLAFSLDRDILFAGLAIQITVCEESLSQYVFHLYINSTNVSEAILPKEVLEYEYTSQKVLDGNDKVDFSAGSSNLAEHIQRISKQLFHVYDLTVSLRTPVVLKKTELNSVHLFITSMPKSGVYLTSYAMSQPNNPLHFNSNVVFRMLSTKSAVSKLYYYV